MECRTGGDLFIQAGSKRRTLGRKSLMREIVVEQK
jgi:hypothetical protein